MNTTITSWGRHPKVKSKKLYFERFSELQSALLNLSGNAIPRGNGRSYGDSALSDNVLCTQNFDCFLDFDEEAGILQVRSGALLCDILESLVPRGWFLPVTPGTQFVSVGGAIASDVHGKNHHSTGTFSEHIISLELMMPDGTIYSCSSITNPDLFRATCGGMGLTGIILSATIRLEPISSAYIAQETIKTGNLNETFEAFEETSNATYSVAWIDCLAEGKNQGRGLVMTGEHESSGKLDYTAHTKVSIPIDLPSFSLNKYTVKAFNELYYGRVRKRQSKQRLHAKSFFYPLDSIANWNRIYGGKGFTQYQFVLPLEHSFTGLQKILSIISSTGKGSFLAVLKKMGKQNENWLSFPMEGYTLALDFRIEPGVFDLLDTLDSIVAEMGGRVYLTKDCRLTKTTMEQTYENVERFRNLRQQYQLNHHLNSYQSKRLEL